MKKEIIQLALECFLEKGINETSMNDIATSAGVTKPAIYYYFKNKDTLIEGVITYFKEEVGKWSQEIHKRDKNVKEYLQNTFLSIKVFSDVTTVLLNKVTKEKKYNFDELLSQFSKINPQAKKDMQEVFTKTRKHIAIKIKEGQKNGEIKSDIDPDILALQIHSIIEGLTTISHIDTSIDLNEVSNKLFNQFWNMIKE